MVENEPENHKISDFPTMIQLEHISASGLSGIYFRLKVLN